MLVLVVICLSLTSCAVFEWLSADTHGEIEWIENEDSETDELLYQDQVYCSTDSWFTLWTKEDDIELGWQYNFPFSNRIGYYSNTAEAPLYIWLSRCVDDYALNVYMKEGWDFQNQLFVLEGTDIEFVFSEMIVKQEGDLEPVNSLSGYAIVIYLKEDPRLEIHMHVYVKGDRYFFVQNGERWFLSKEFVSLLKQADMIPQ